MYGFIFGFHRLARCPKCTPASIRSLTASATGLPPSTLVGNFRADPPAGNVPRAALAWGVLDILSPTPARYPNGPRFRRQIGGPPPQGHSIGLARGRDSDRPKTDL